MEQRTRPRSMRSTLRPDIIMGSKNLKGMESISLDDTPELLFSKKLFTDSKSIVVCLDLILSSSSGLSCFAYHKTHPELVGFKHREQWAR